MKSGFAAALLVCAAFATALLATPAAAARPDVIWARSTNGQAITLDGLLNEPAWALAESVKVRYGYDNGIPGSGWKQEGGYNITDTTRATIKFLRDGNQLYAAFIVPDSSIGGSEFFNYFDGLLMGIHDHTQTYRPAPVAEYFYSWWTDGDVNPQAPGKMPNFRGRWANTPWTDPRTPEQIAAWDAATVVYGQTNKDTVGAGVRAPDTRYVVEMRFDMGVMGYNFNQAGGDVGEWNVSIYDCDWYWPGARPQTSAYRAWWQGPWGNTSWYSEVRVWGRSDVTISSGPVPDPGPELTIPNAGAVASPVVDGALTDPFWAGASSFTIKYGDNTVRDAYGPVAKWRAGEYQATVNGGVAFVSDPTNATIKWAVKNDSLFIGFDVPDQVVQYIADFDRWDGALVTLNDRVVRGNDNQLIGRRLSFQVGPTGQALAGDFLPFLRDTLFGAKLAMQLKPGTTVDTTGASPDAGWTAELMIDLTKFGYPAGLGDRVIFIGINILDGDSFGNDFTSSYGTRTWIWREYEGQCCAPWGYLQPSTVAVEDPPPFTDQKFALLGAYPNPTTGGATVRYSLASASRVTLEMYDPQGRLVSLRPLGVQPAGLRQAAYDGSHLPTGMYLYRLRITDPVSGVEQATLSGKALIVR